MSMRSTSGVVISVGCHWRGKVAVREEGERTERTLLRFLDSETNEGVIVKSR